MSQSPPHANKPFKFEGSYREQKVYDADESIEVANNTVQEADISAATGENAQQQHTQANTDQNQQNTNADINADNPTNQTADTEILPETNTQRDNQQGTQAHIEPQVHIQRNRVVTTPPLVRTHRYKRGDSPQFDRIQRTSTQNDERQTRPPMQEKNKQFLIEQEKQHLKDLFKSQQRQPTHNQIWNRRASPENRQPYTYNRQRRSSSEDRGPKTVVQNRYRESSPKYKQPFREPPIERQVSRQDSMRSLLNGFQNLNVRHDPNETVIFKPPVVKKPVEYTAKPPMYVPVAQQALQIHKDAIREQTQKADMLQKMVHLLIETKLDSNDQISSEFESFAKDLAADIHQTRTDAAEKSKGIQRAAQIVDYYQTPIQRPEIDHDTFFPDVRLNLKELIMITGYFDPSNSQADFKHVWHKLLDYGQSQNYQEKHYIIALGAILQKEAYETFCDFKQSDRSLDDILQYFAKVYTKQRSAMDDREAVDNFTRKRGESIVVCMDRCILAIDKLRLKYEPYAWPHIRQFMRKNILMQVIREETKRHIQIKEDEITETTGLPYDFENLIKEADRFERYQNKAPDKDVACMFKVASGGLVSKAQENAKIADQLQHFKREQKYDQHLQSLVSRLEQLEANSVAPRTFKNQGKPEDARQSRSTERFSNMKSRRDESLNRARDLTKTIMDDEDVDMTPVSKSRTDKTPPMKPTPAPYKPPNPFKPNEPVSHGQPPSRDLLSHGQPPRNPQVPFQYPQNGRPQQQSQSPYRQSWQQQQRPTSQSPYRGREQSRSPVRAATPFNNAYNSRNQSQNNSRSNSQQRSWSQNRNQQHYKTGNAKSVYISINGQDYQAFPQQEN